MMKQPNPEHYDDGHEYYYDLASYWEKMFNAVALEFYGVRPHDADLRCYTEVVKSFEDEI